MKTRTKRGKITPFHPIERKSNRKRQVTLEEDLQMATLGKRIK